jgi:signal peptidase I
MDMPRAIKNLVLIGSSAYFVKTQVGEVLYGKGPSMEPTIPNGSFVLIDRMSWRWRKYERGDIVLMKSPTRPNTTICKRILAMVNGLD